MCDEAFTNKINLMLSLNQNKEKAFDGITYELYHKKTGIVVSDCVRHNIDCTSTEDG